MLFKDVLEMIGHTPLVRINRVNPYSEVEIYAKLEGTNPGGSIKDRIALRMVEEAEKTGELNKKKTIIEPTSGNTGIGLAMVAAVKGYPIEIVMSESVSVERRKVLEGLGAKILLSPAEEGTDGAIRMTERMVKRSPHRYFFPNQYANKSNYLAHYHGTAEEIIGDLPDITHFVASLGTTGTLVGNSMRLKEYRCNIRIIAAEPRKGHKIQGLKSLAEAIVPPIYDERKIDERVVVDDEEAFNMTRRLAKEEGIFVGMSSGAAMVAALESAKDMQKGKIVVIFPDRGEKYLSTPLFRRDKMSLKLYNTLTRKKEKFIPIHENKVTFYSCGPTVYWYQHIGNLRTYIFNDILKRAFMYNGFEVTHVMNYTDVGHLTSDADTGEDKIEAAAKKEKKSAQEIAEHYTKVFDQDCLKLNIIPPDITCKATDYIKEQIDLIRNLEEKGYTYKTDDGIYFDTSKVEDYGKLGRLNIEGLEAGKRVDLAGKKNKTDFALWKFSEEPGIRQQEWDSPWGVGFPGWHTECCAMATKHLGKQFDIHTGGEDHVQVHHTNEIAQSEAAYGVKPWVRYWMHGSFLLFKGEKVSKSKGGLHTIKELEDMGFEALDYRYLCLNAHYRKQLNFSIDNLTGAKNTYDRLKNIIIDLKSKGDSKKTESYDEYKRQFVKDINDDLNMPRALSVLWDVLRDIELGSKEKLELAYDFDRIFGLGMKDMKEAEIDDDIKALVDKREEARKRKDFATADRIRDELKEKGIILEDTPEGVKWKKA